ncbi:hypothetical protein KSP40_PGU003555 [Platanthera guangdongensis]|uniref:Uncharacterized protein n=1 Tax=Platanthera guangdongensis TaxID=2320717 RepID=A0ABR2LBR6_9ASPA
MNQDFLFNLQFVCLKAVIRVLFPDYYILEAKFKSSEEIQKLVDLLRKVLPDQIYRSTCILLHRRNKLKISQKISTQQDSFLALLYTFHMISLKVCFLVY